MMKFAWEGYREKAWGFNEVKPDTGRPSTNNIFGPAKTGATIIDALDTLWIMELHEEFEQGENWVRESFNLKVSNSMLSCFETVIRFLGGLLGAYHMSGNELFLQKASNEWFLKTENALYS
jgi:mannosyl-oligosaccharide alpha-1,2-mannosidase